MCFLVALTIAAYHFMQQFPNSLYAYNGWQMGVEFFYILSGLLLAKSAERSEGTGFSYTWKSIKSIYLLYFLTMLFNLIVYCIDTHKSFISMAGRSVMSFLFLQESVRGVVGFLPPNGPAWFLSGLIVMGLAVYEFKQRSPRFFIQLIAPFSVLLIYTYFLRKVGEIVAWKHYVLLNIPATFLRAFAGCA